MYYVLRGSLLGRFSSTKPRIVLPHSPNPNRIESQDEILLREWRREARKELLEGVMGTTRPSLPLLVALVLLSVLLARSVSASRPTVYDYDGSAQVEVQTKFLSSRRGGRGRKAGGVATRAVLYEDDYEAEYEVSRPQPGGSLVSFSSQPPVPNSAAPSLNTGRRIRRLSGRERRRRLCLLRRRVR